MSVVDRSSSIPRAWELSPVLSVIHQLCHGTGPSAERVRKGLAQSLGRYATNLKEPVGYFPPKLDISSIPEYFKAVIYDNPSGTWAAKWHDGDSKDSMGIGARAALYREMFDLPSFENLPHPSLEKIGRKEYKLTASPTEFAEIPPPGKNGASAHHVLGGVYLQSSDRGHHEFRDTWDIVTSGEEHGTSSPADPEGGTRKIRLLISKLLKPATVRGTINPLDEQREDIEPAVQEYRHSLMGRPLTRPVSYPGAMAPSAKEGCQQ
jgi:hypothetical protein